MTAETEAELAAWYMNNIAYFGLSFEPSSRFTREVFTPRFLHSESKCLRFEMPDSPSGFAYLASILPSLLSGFDRDHWRGGAVVYQDFDVWDHRNNVEGWTMIERIRAGYGELRPFTEATANVFRDNDLSILPAFLLAPLIWGWDAFYLPLDRGSFASISHDGIWFIDTETESDHMQLLEKLSSYPKDHWLRSYRLMGAPGNSTQ